MFVNELFYRFHLNVKSVFCPFVNCWKKAENRIKKWGSSWERIENWIEKELKIGVGKELRIESRKNWDRVKKNWVSELRKNWKSSWTKKPWKSRPFQWNQNPFLIKRKNQIEWRIKRRTIQRVSWHLSRVYLCKISSQMLKFGHQNVLFRYFEFRNLHFKLNWCRCYWE